MDSKRPGILRTNQSLSPLLEPEYRLYIFSRFLYIMGPLQLADFIGLDVCHSILQVLHDGFGNPKYAPCPLLPNMVTANKLGVKTGEGFYVYSKDSKELVVSERFKKINK